MHAFRLAPALAIVVGWAWLGCDAHVITQGGAGTTGAGASSGTGGTGGAGGTGCSGDLVCPSICLDGMVAQLVCENGALACVPVPCASTSGTTSGSSSGSGCDGSPLTVCVNGMLSSSCCPAGAPCEAAQYCDLGNGACIAGTPCSNVDGGNCGSIDASSYDQQCTHDSDCVSSARSPCATRAPAR